MVANLALRIQIDAPVLAMPPLDDDLKILVPQLLPLPFLTVSVTHFSPSLCIKHSQHPTGSGMAPSLALLSSFWSGSLQVLRSGSEGFKKGFPYCLLIWDRWLNLSVELGKKFS